MVFHQIIERDGQAKSLGEYLGAKLDASSLLQYLKEKITMINEKLSLR